MYFELNIAVPSRHTPFGGNSGDGDIYLEGINWSAASFTMAIATTAGGSPVKTLSTAAAGSEGISASWDASYVNDEGTVVGRTLIRIQIDETAMEALAHAEPADTIFYYDMLVTPSGEVQRPFCGGTFTVSPGVAD